MLATAIPKRHYYYLSEFGRRLFDLAIGPLTLAFVGVVKVPGMLARRKI